MNAEYVHGGSCVEQITSMDKLVQVKALDDLAFGTGLGIVGIEMEELQHIVEHGAIFAFQSPYSMMGEIQVLTSSTPEYHLDDVQGAYCYGVAVHPNFQDASIAQELLHEQEQFAKMHGKTHITCTIRVENGKSIRAFTKAGFQIVGYDPTHYGPMEEGGARLWLQRDIGQPITCQPKQLVLLFQNGIIPSFTIEGKQQDELCAVPVMPGVMVDIDAHHAIQELLQQSYKGIGVLTPSEVPAIQGAMALIFQKHL